MSAENISERLKVLRLSRGLTVKDMAAQIDVPETTYREWEYGRAITGEPYVKMAMALKVSVYYLLTGQEPKRAREMKKILTDLKNMLELLESHLMSFF